MQLAFGDAEGLGQRKQVEPRETGKASMRSKVDHRFRVIKRQFG